jgi:hypothetical protein
VRFLLDFFIDFSALQEITSLIGWQLQSLKATAQ